MAGRFVTLAQALSAAPAEVREFVRQARDKCHNEADDFSAAVTRVLMLHDRPLAMYSLAFTTVDDEQVPYIAEAYSKAGSAAVRWGLAEACEVVRNMGFPALYFAAERRGWQRRAAHYGFRPCAVGAFSFVKEVHNGKRG